MLQNEASNVIIRALRTDSFRSRVALGLVPGWTSLNKFGAGEADTTFKVVYPNMLNAQYPFLIDENKVMTIQSDNVGDVGQKIEVQYVEYDAEDGSWNYKKGEATTNGLTPVTLQELDSEGNAIGDANVMIPYRMINKGTGISNQGGLLGNLTLENTSVVYAEILNGDNQSLLAYFPVATGYKAIILGVGRSVVGVNKDADFHYKAIPYGEPSQTKRTTALVQSSDYETFPIPYTFDAKTILTVEAKVGSGTAQVSAWFDGFIVEEQYLK